MRILIAAGGTGGHLFPAIRLSEELKVRCMARVLFITSCRKQDGDILKGKDIAFRTLPVIPLQSRDPFSILNFLVRLAAAAIKSLFLVLAFRPSAVIGFGGYLSGPPLLLSALLGIRTVIHEQNVYPGKANRILARFVNKIAISFPETRGYLKRFESKIVVSGNPLRHGLKRFQKTGSSFTVLIMGGSQGAHTLNRLMPEAIDLIPADKKGTLDIIHIAGHRERNKVVRSYQERAIKSRVFSFIEGIDRFYNESDFVIARAGATTISELLYLAKPSILIPYSHAGAHQQFNARVMQDTGGAVLLEEERLLPEDLRDIIIRFMDRELLDSMSKGIKTSTKDACNILIAALQ